MHRRILFGVAAWLLGAATATAGSLLAVSLLGQGITGNSGQLLTQDAVNRALASEAAEASQSATPTVTPGKPAATQASPRPTADKPTAVGTPAPPPSPETTSTAPASDDGTVLTSAGGEVVASCRAAGAYLVSWSPLQGFEVTTVARGPASVARVTFSSATSQVTMAVSCSDGVPTATSGTWKGGDD